MRCQRVSKVCPEPSEDTALPAPNSQLLALTTVQGRLSISAALSVMAVTLATGAGLTIAHMHPHTHAFTCTSACKHAYIHEQAGMHLPKYTPHKGRLSPADSVSCICNRNWTGQLLRIYECVIVCE